MAEAKKTMKKTAKAAAKKTAAKKAAKPLSPAQETWRITWKLRGDLKRARRLHLDIGRRLTDIRDQKRYADLGHPDMETYAEQELRLGRSSLYKYLQVYEWVARRHPEWLNPKAGQFIPDLNDTGGLMWIEAELEKKGLDAERRAALEVLQKKGIAGTLTQRELSAFRRQGRPAQDALKTYLSSLRSVRRRGARLATLPAEVLAHLDSAIGILANERTLRLAGLGHRPELDAGLHNQFVA